MLWGSLYVTFNAPPGWPTFPKGWVPQQGWTPDPTWPPAPHGWDFVVVRRRRYWLGVLDRPVLRDWLFWVAAVGLLLGRARLIRRGWRAITFRDALAVRPGILDPHATGQQ